MNDSVSLRVQTVLYHNKKESVVLSLDCLSNSVRKAKENGINLSSVEVFYGDASSEPMFSADEVKEIRTRFSDTFVFSCVFFDENTGTSKGHNTLFASCTSDYLFIMNPDVVVAPNTIENLLKPLLKNNKIGIGECKQLPIEHPKEFDIKTGRTAWASGACEMVRAQVFREVGGYDAETFFMYCDDVDLSWRVRLKGYEVVYCPDAAVFHSKFLQGKASFEHSETEEALSAQASLLMAYKWCFDKFLKKTLRSHAKSDKKILQKAVVDFETRKKQGRLPERLDPSHTVAKMYGMEYAKRRYEV